MSKQYYITKVLDKARQGNSDAIEALILHYDPRIEYVVDYFMTKYDCGILDKEDLIQEGRLGILKNINKDNFFINVGWFIGNEIRYCITANTKIDSQYIDDLDEDSFLYIDTIINNINEYDKQYLHKVCNKCLKNREKLILKYRFGFYNDNQLSREKIGLLLGISGERVKQIEHRAIKKLKNKILKDEKAKIQYQTTKNKFKLQNISLDEINSISYYKYGYYIENNKYIIYKYLPNKSKVYNLGNTLTEQKALELIYINSIKEK